MIRGRSCQVSDSSPADRGQEYGSDQASIFRLIIHRSAIASRRSLTGLHPHASALLRWCFTGSRLSPAVLIGRSVFCSPCRFPCFPQVSDRRKESRSPPVDQRNIPTDRSRKLLWLGDYRKLLLSGAFSSGSRSHPGKPDHKRQPMRW